MPEGPINRDDLEDALNRVVDADDLIRTALTQDDRIDNLLAKAQRILHETGDRIQNVLDEGDSDT